MKKRVWGEKWNSGKENFQKCKGGKTYRQRHAANVSSLMMKIYHGNEKFAESEKRNFRKFPRETFHPEHAANVSFWCLANFVRRTSGKHLSSLGKHLSSLGKSLSSLGKSLSSLGKNTCLTGITNKKIIFFLCDLLLIFAFIYTYYRDLQSPYIWNYIGSIRFPYFCYMSKIHSCQKISL